MTEWIVEPVGRGARLLGEWEQVSAAGRPGRRRQGGGRDLKAVRGSRGAGGNGMRAEGPASAGAPRRCAGAWGGQQGAWLKRLEGTAGLGRETRGWCASRTLEDVAPTETSRQHRAHAV